MKMTYQQMILIFILVALMFFTINWFYPNYGPLVTMGGMITIFIIFKLRQSMSGGEEED